jgi:hypothetical protein
MIRNTVILSVKSDPNYFALAAPEASASTNSATSAGKVRTIMHFLTGGALYSKATNPVNQQRFPEWSDQLGQAQEDHDQQGSGQDLQASGAEP